MRADVDAVLVGIGTVLRDNLIDREVKRRVVPAAAAAESL